MPFQFPILADKKRFPLRCSLSEGLILFRA